MTPLLIKYPFDPTGEAPTNRVTDEVHTLPRTRNRSFALNAGPFYADSVIIRTLPGNQVLERNVHYRALYLYEYYTRKTGMPVTAVIHVFDETIQGAVTVEYQVVGGEASSNTTAIQQLIQSLEIDNRGIVFDDIIDLPVTWPPSPHLHHVGDWYGMEALIDAIQDLTVMMDGTRTEAFDQISARMDTLNQHLLANQASIAQAHQLIATANGNIDGLQLALSATNANLAQTDARHTALVGQHAALASVVNQIQITHSQMLARITALEGSVFGN